MQPFLQLRKSKKDQQVEYILRRKSSKDMNSWLPSIYKYERLKGFTPANEST